MPQRPIPAKPEPRSRTEAGSGTVEAIEPTVTEFPPSWPKQLTLAQASWRILGRPAKARRMFKNAVQRGRSEGEGEAYPCGTLSP